MPKRSGTRSRKGGSESCTPLPARVENVELILYETHDLTKVKKEQAYRTAWANIRDPVPPDERSLAIGRDVYTTYCETCHGETGHGDGPAGLRLNPRPADLRIHTAPGVHTDGELFYWVSYGFPNSAMPACRRPRRNWA